MPVSPLSPNPLPLETGLPPAAGDAFWQRPLELWLIRESDEYNMQLFDAMREQTYAAARGDAAVEAVAALGLEPLRQSTLSISRTDDSGRTVQDLVIVEELRRGKTRARLFSYGGRYHLWSQASAHRTDEQGQNEFTQILVDVIGRVRPVSLRSATISRLVRSKEQAAYLLSQLSGAVDRVVAGEMRLELAGETASTGWLMFNFLGMTAALERDWIVSRLQVGKVAKWRRGEWPFGAGIVPFGYIYDQRAKRLLPDMSRRDAVRDALVLLGTSLPPKELLSRLDALGVKLQSSATGGAERPIGQAVNPTEVLSGLYRWIPLWTAGEYLMRVANAIPSAEHVAGLEVVRAHPDDRGEIQMLHTVAVPPGGWAQPAVHAAAQAAALRWIAQHGAVEHGRPLAQEVRAASGVPALHEHSRRLGRAKSELESSTRGLRRSPLLVGRWWVTGEFRYELRSEVAQSYTVTRVPLSERPSGTNAATSFTAARVDAVPVARVAFDELHRGFAQALARACRDGISAFALTGSTTLLVGATPVVVSVRDAAIRDLKAQIKNDSHRERQVYEDSLSATDPERARELKERADAIAREVRRARARLADLETEHDATPQEFDADVDVLLAALTRLQSSGSFTLEEVNAFRTVVPDFRIWQDDEGQWIASASVRLPSDGGVMTYGPIAWPIRAAVRGAQAVSARLPDARVSRVDPRRRQDLLAALESCGATHGAALTLLQAPFPELAQLVLHRGDLAGLPEWVEPEWREPRFAEHVAAVYLDTEYVGLGVGRYVTQSPERQAILATLAKHGGTASFEQILGAAPGLRPVDIRGLTNPRSARGVRPWSRLWHYDAAKDVETVTALRCVCGQVPTVLARVPEVPADLLCGCGRVPNGAAFDGRIVFPAAYRHLAMSTAEWQGHLAEPKAPLRRAAKGQRRTEIIEALLHRPDRTAAQIAVATGISKGVVMRILRQDRTFVRGGGVEAQVPTNGPAPVRWSVRATG